MPEVKLVKDVYGDKAKKLMKYMPGVFELESVGGKVKAVVKYPQNCRMSRNYTRDEVLKESVVVTRRPDHFAPQPGLELKKTEHFKNPLSSSTRRNPSAYYDDMA